MKDVLSDLKTAVALNTEVQKGLKEFMQTEFSRHYDFQKSSDQRVAVTEAKIDRHEILFVKIEGLPGRISNLETLAEKLEDDFMEHKGFPQRIEKLENAAKEAAFSSALAKAWKSGVLWVIGPIVLFVGWFLGKLIDNILIPFFASLFTHHS